MRPIALITFLALLVPAPARAATPRQGEWVTISDSVLEQIEKQGQKPAWPGKTAGVVVDASTGNVYMVVPGRGLWRSADKGATFTRVDGGAVGGRCETGYSLHGDPAGGRLACFMLDGRSAMTLDGGKTWRPIKNVARGYDWGGVVWSQPGAQTLFGRVHEQHGAAALSLDGGKTWKPLGDEFGPLGVFNENVLVASRGREPKWSGIVRSADAGATWQHVSDATPIGAMALLKGTGYWLSDQGLLTSADQGQTWQRIGSVPGAVWGPYFGKSERHFVVVSREGFHETSDGGRTWTLIAPYPPSLRGEFNTRGWMMNFAWDPIGKVCYVSRMGQPTCKCEY